MALNLKVEVGAAQMYRFNQDMTVFEVCKQIREKSAGLEGSGADHGLFQPGDGVRMGRWLRPERTLMFYDMKSGDLVMYRKKHRPLKVKLMDDTCKMVLVDDSEAVWQIVEVIGQKLDIKNAEEYSLARILPPPPPNAPPQPPMGTPWLAPTQSLADQGIEPNDTVLFKKKFFVTDAAVDKSDPIQLNLLYVQCRDMVTSGTLPCQLQEAVQLAALQLQVDEGTYNGTRYEKKGAMKELYPKLLPPNFQRQAPNAEKDILATYKTLAGMSDVNAKYRYVSFTRSLKLYGLTCYEVQERDPKNPKKNRAVLLGVSKEQILRLDRETRDEFHRNELTQLKRWAASPNTLTLDFGDYEPDYYVVTTPEGEAISQLIAGYIDIILKRKRDIGRKEVEDDSGAAAEEFIAPIRSQAVETTTTSIGLGAFNAAAGQEGVMGPGGQSASMSGGEGGGLGGRGVNAGKGQQMPVGRAIVDPTSAAAGLKDMLDELEEADPWARLPSELSPEQWRQKLQEALMATGANVTELVKNASMADKSAMNQTSKTLFQNVMDLMHAARMGGLEGEDDLSLLEGAKLVADAVRRILECAKDLAENPADPALRARVAEAARLLQAAQIQLGQGLQGKLISDPDSADLVLQSAKAVTAAAKALKDVTDQAAARIPDPAKKDPLKDAAEGEYQAAQSLYELSKALAPVILAPGAKGMLEENAKGLQGRLGELLRLAKLGVSDPSLLDRIAKATKDVNDAVAQLLLANDCAATTDAQDLAYHQRRIGEGVILIEEHKGQRAEIVRGSGQVGQSGLALVAGAKRTATLLDPAAQEHLLASAKILAEHTNQSVAAAKTAIGNLNDDNAHARLLEAAQRVKKAADQLVSDAGKAVQYKVLEHAAKNAAAATGALYHTGRAALVAGHVTDEPNKNRLNEETTRAKAALDKLLDAIKKVNAAPDDKKTLEELYQASKNATTPGLKMANAARAAIPRINDMATKRDLNTDAESAKRALQALQAAIRGVAEATGAREVEDAQLLAETAVAEADALALNAAEGRYAEPQFQLEPSLAALEQAAQKLAEAAQELRDTAVNKPDHVGLAARSAGRAVSELSDASRNVVLSTADKAVQGAVCDATKHVATRLKEELNAARARVVSPEDKACAVQLDASANAVRTALQALLAAASGGDVAAAECDEAAAAIEAETKRIDERSPSAGLEWAQGAEELDGKAKQLSAALTQVVVSSKSNPRTLGTAASTSVVAFQGFVESLNAAIGAAPAADAKRAVAAPAREVGASAAALVSLAKVARRDPARMDAAYVTLSRALQNLLNAVDASTPGSTEIAAALDAILAALARLGAHDANVDKAEHRQRLNEAAKSLNDTVATLSASARTRPDALGGLASNTATAVNSALTSAAGLTPDILELGHALDRISDALAALSSPATVLPAAKEVARAAHALVLQTRAFVPANPSLDREVKRELVQSAQAVAALTSRLAAAAKAQVSNPSGGDSALKGVQKELQQRVEAVRAAQGKVAAKAKHPAALLNAARAVGESCAAMVRTLKAVNARPKDSSSQSQLTTNTIGVTESVKRMVEAATALVPGQRECDDAIAKIQNEIGELAAQAVVAAVGVFAHRLPEGLTVSAAQESVATAAEKLGAAANRLAEAGKGSGAIGPQAEAVAQAATVLTSCTLDAAATTTDPATQQARLNMAKGVDEAVLNLVRAVKVSAANPTPVNQKGAVDAANAVKEAVNSVVSQMKHNVQGLRLCDEAIASIRQTEAQLPQPPKDTSKSYGEVRAALQASGRELVQTIGGILQNAAAGSADDVGAKSQRTAELLARYIDTTKLVIVATADAQDRQALSAAAKAVCQTAAALIDTAKKLTPDSKNQDLQSKMNAAFASVTEAIRALGETISRAAKGERDCEAALDELQRLNGDLEMAALFAATGQLDPADAGTTIETHHAALTAAAAELDREQEALVAASNRSLDAVGTSARNTAAAMSKLAKASKGAAALLNDDQAQKGILGSVKNLGSATQQLVQLSKDLQTAPTPDSKARQAEAQETIKESLAMLTEIVNGAAGQIVRGLQELEKAKNSIAKCAQTIDSAPGKSGATAKDAGDAARRMVAANNELIGALATQNWDAIAAAAQAEASANTDLLLAVKGAVASSACDASVRAAVMSAAKAAALTTAKLLEAAKFYRPDSTESQAKLTAVHEELQQRLQAFVSAARQLPEGQDLDLDGEALARQTEQELLAAAAQIEEAGARIKAPKPREQWPNDQQRQAQISEAILDAAKAISKATGGLMQATVAAQRELAAKGRANKLANPYQKDPAWAQSLIAAARAVAVSNDSLVRDANTASDKRGHEEQLANSAKEVANTTAKLVAASKTKADSNSPAQAKLEVAAKSVALATQKLVEACKIAANIEEEERLAKAQREADKEASAQRDKEFKLQVEIARLEKELQRAKARGGITTAKPAAPGKLFNN